MLVRLTSIFWPAAAVVLFVALALTDTAAATSVAGRLLPVLVFAAAMSAMVNLAAQAGVFEALAAWIERTHFVWPAFLVLCVFVTIFLSLDTTAIMLTPLAVAVARRNGLSVVALSLSVVWIANLGSMLLPVSNLTNLLALKHYSGTYDFVAASWRSALVGIAVAVAASYVARFIFGAEKQQHSPSAPPSPGAALWILGLTVVALLTPIPFWATSVVGAVAMALAVGVENRGELVPWQSLALVVAISSAVALLPPLHINAPAALSGTVAANLVNNLPAYLLLEGDEPMQLLVGVNFGPLITPWASLATLLWHSQLERAGIQIPWRVFIAFGCVLVPLAVWLGSAVA
ncbi:arsenical pump membrane protein [Corynebacterium imitans]|uniref:Arsenical pump membrane protein n=1 Tax=Corynebacterium imitans TaxID=156978 RepID=A0A239YUM9_9CORY|nr:arsenical pump membrane protein [Corynebacterium imitans]